MNRGRPSENIEILKKHKQVFYEFPSKPELGTTTTWHHDLDKAPNGPYKVEIAYPKDYKYEKFKIDKDKAYNNQPVVMIFKTSNRSNAQTKIKIWNNKNIDYIISSPSLPGVPKNAIILELGIGKSFIDSFKSKYFL
jgi:hypothetical protein